MHPKKILVPTDYSLRSRSALTEALRLAQEDHSELVLLHVVDTLGPENLPYGESASARQPDAYRQRLFDELSHILPDTTSIHVEFVLSEEEEVTAILRTQAEHNCDLIVMASHGFTGWRRWLYGSIAEKVVRQATCPVLVVKEPREPAELPKFGATQMHPGHLTRVSD